VLPSFAGTAVPGVTKTLQVQSRESLLSFRRTRLVKGPFVVVRGFVAGALWLLAALAVTLGLIAVLQDRAADRNERAGASQPSTWGSPTSTAPGHD
jgi:hypothetical protein